MYLVTGQRTALPMRSNTSESFRIAPVRSLLAPERVRRDEPIATKLEVGSDAGGPFIVDTFQLPYDNPFNALFYVTGVDFLPNDLIAICTAHGDVWLARNERRASVEAASRPVFTSHLD